jgi:hypothetical protein
MKKIALLFSLVSLLFVAFTTQAEDTVVSSTGKFDKHVHYLFVQAGRAVSLQPNQDQSNTYQLIFNNIDPYTNYFSDRPSRTAGFMSMDQFIKNWSVVRNKDNFSKDAPNAMLRAAQVDKNGEITRLGFVLVLTKPVYDAQAKTLAYTVKILESDPSLKTPLTDKLQFDFASLFIDNFCAIGC